MNPAGPGSLSHTPLSGGDRRKRATGVVALAAISFLLLALIASPQGGSATSSLVMVTASELEGPRLHMHRCWPRARTRTHCAWPYSIIA